MMATVGPKPVKQQCLNSFPAKLLTPHNVDKIGKKHVWAMNAGLRPHVKLSSKHSLTFPGYS